MDLIRITDQSKESLSEFYVREAENDGKDGASVRAKLVEMMVDLIDYLRNSVEAPPVYAVTSHFKLHLLTGDDYRLPTLATIEAVVDGPKTFGFDIAYELPLEHAPWKNAWVHGLAIDTPQAAQMILIALQRNAYAN